MEQIALLPSCKRKVSIVVAGNIVYGSIPPWLRGYFIRYGSTSSHNHGNFEGASPDPDECEFKNGAGLLQKFEFKKGKVLHSIRWIQTEDTKLDENDSRRVNHTLTAVSIPDPCEVIFRRLSATFSNSTQIGNNASTANLSVYPIGDQVFIVGEKGLAHRIELGNLGSTMKVNLLQECGLHLSTHPQIFEYQRRIYTIGQKLDVFKRPQYVVTEMSANSILSGSSSSPWSKVKIVATVPSRWLTKVSYMHTFAVTTNYFIIIEQPVCQFHPEVMLNLTHHSNKMLSSLYYPKKNTLFHVVSRDGTGLRKTYSCTAFFFMHTINAYENWQGDISVDICCYGSPKCVKALYKKAPQTSLVDDLEFARSFCSRPYRFSLIRKLREEEGTAPAYKELLVDFGCELPKINERYRTQMYRYFYGIASDISGNNAGSVVKVNVELGTVKVWRESVVRSYASEPVFVRNPGGIEEDDGLLLATLYYGRNSQDDVNRTSVAILDARRLELLAKVDFNVDPGVPNCCHGWFFPHETDDES